MFARVTTFEVQTEGAQGVDEATVQQATSYIQEQVIPFAKQLKGYVHGYWLADRQSGEVLAITLWQSDEDLNASADAIRRSREEATARLGLPAATSVKTYEVITEG